MTSLKEKASHLKAVTLSETQLTDLEMISNGAYFPLKGFMGRNEIKSVEDKYRLPSGEPFGAPIELRINKELADDFRTGDEIALRNTEGVNIAIMTIEGIFPSLNNNVDQISIGGKIQVIEHVPHYHYAGLRKTPKEIKKFINDNKYQQICGVVFDSPIHQSGVKSLQELLRVEKTLLIFVTECTNTNLMDDRDIMTVRAHEKVIHLLNNKNVIHLLIPKIKTSSTIHHNLSQSLILKNFGVTHLTFQHESETHQHLKNLLNSTGLTIIQYPRFTYCEKEKMHLPIEAAKRPKDISAHELVDLIKNNKEIPSWFTFESVINEMRKTHRPKNKKGFSIMLYGLSGAGKSTIANYLKARLLEMDERYIHILDGDEIRNHLSKGLGFSKEDRLMNVKRVGYVCNLLAKTGGIAISALISPFNIARSEIKKQASLMGVEAIEVYIATPIETCEKRDRKGLYAKARSGEIINFTGVSGPFEIPTNPDLTINTTEITPLDAVEMIINLLREKKYL